jgi:Ca2+-transporting ATPase
MNPAGADRRAGWKRAVGTVPGPRPAAATRAADRGEAWHAREAERVVSELCTSLDGLTDREAAERLARDGPNRLPAPAISAGATLVKQLRRPVVLLLAAAAGLSLAIGQTLDAAVIAAVLAVSVLLAAAAAWRGRRTRAALHDLAPPHAAVLRQGRLSIVDAASLVQGDVLQFDAGSRVPADARLVHAVDLCVLETALTGEPQPVEKTTEPLPAPVVRLGDRANMIHMGTVVVRGSGRAVVTATGARTELGRIASLIEGIHEDEPQLTRRLDMLAERAAWIAIGLAGLVGLLGLARGVPIAVVLQTGVAFAVAALPLGLPLVAAVAMAVGVRCLARRHAVVRRAPAVQALGSTTVICADTASALTGGRMLVASVWTAGRYHALDSGDLAVADEPAVRHALEFAVFASRPQPRPDWGGVGAADPVDLAVQAALDGAGASSQRLLADHPPEAVLPFCCGRGLMATFHRRHGRLYAYVKGAPERVMAMSDRVMTADGPRHLDEWRGAELLRANETLARDGLRVLGLATGYVEHVSESALRGLTFEAFLGLATPPVPGLKDTFADLREAGVRLVMITGDQRPTAEAIGRQLGLLDGRAGALDAEDLDSLSPGELAAAAANVQVYSRMSPEHRLRIVRALRQRGEIVAVLGEGVNDAAALEQADVGIALDRCGSGIARESADLILRDDRLQTVAAAVEEGRVILHNSRTFVFYLFGCTAAELLVLLLAGLAALPVPLHPMQLLWLNLVIATCPALALAAAPCDRRVMRRPSRQSKEGIFSRPFLAGIAISGAALAAATLGAYAWGLAAHVDHASTLAFMTLGFGQIANVANVRGLSALLPPARVLTNPAATGAVAIAVGLLLATVLEPFAGLLHVMPLDTVEWSVVAAGGALPGLAGHVFRRLHPSSS